MINSSGVAEYVRRIADHPRLVKQLWLWVNDATDAVAAEDPVEILLGDGAEMSNEIEHAYR